MSDTILRDQPLQRPGPLSSYSVIGEVTEGLHRLLLDRYDLSGQPPRIEEDLKFVPKDREEVVYIYMYRAVQNPNLLTEKRWRPAPLDIPGYNPEGGDPLLYQRPPLIMDLFYLIAVHSRFRSDAERLMGWTLMTLWENPVLLKRPRRFVLPDGRVIDSLGRDWDPSADPDEEPEAGVNVERVALSLVDDLTIGDAINLFTIHEAPYRPFLTYRARVAMLGSIIATGDTVVRVPRAVPAGGTLPQPEIPGREVTRSGRIKSTGRRGSPRNPPGPPAHNLRKIDESTDNKSED